MGVELAKRSRSSNEGTELGAFLADLETEVRRDKLVLEDIMDKLGARKSRAKTGGAWLAEKAGRLKLNGRITGYSDLSRLLEIEGLCLGVEGKLSLWRSLRANYGADERLRAADFDELVARAERQRASLEEHRLAAAAKALS